MGVEEEKEVSLNFFQKEKDLLRLHAVVDSTKSQMSGKVLFVIDKSGSMHSDWHQVQSAVRYMQECGDLNPDFMVYDDVARFCSMADIFSMNAGSCTNFSAAFNLIREYINKEPANSHINIVFMTDGHNNGPNLPNAISMLKVFLKSCRRTSCIHTIGFSRGHDRKTLDDIRVLGTSEGVYRFADSEGLEDKFSELFDFISFSQKVSLSFGKDFNQTFDSCKTEDGQIVDVMLKLSTVDPSSSLFNGDTCTIKLNDEIIELNQTETDVFFELRKVEEFEIITAEDLQKADKLLAAINPGKASKDQRRKVLELKMVVQEKLDKFHQLFAEIARGLISGDSISAQLNSLRHETKFGKARRARAMDKRIASNIDEMLEIDDKLNALPPPDLKSFENLNLTCGLSNSSILEIMKDSNSDFLVFPLRIARPESAIDAPTLIVIEKLLVGQYSFDSFKDSLKYAITNHGSQKALGGFTQQSHTNDAAVGLFRGMDGELTNACLPLYINEDHWRRVEIQIKPILGYFFTMDPLGYKGDQIIALFMILGHMLCCRANGEFVSEYADWLIDDFTKVCKSLLPMLMKYLGEGRYSGRIRGDLVEEFLEDPKNRTKESLNHLLVIVGWNHCKCIRELNTLKFDMAFVEEVWRRCFTAMFKGQPRNQAEEWLEQLLYFTPDETTDTNDDTNNESNSDATSGNTMKNEDKLFVQFCKAKLDQVSKAKAKEILTKYPKGPSVDVGNEATYCERNIVNYEDNAEGLDKLVDSILSRIASKNEFLKNLYDGAVTGCNIPGKVKWLMLIQALYYSSNSTMNTAVSNGNYKNTFDYCKDNVESEYTTEDYLKHIHQKYETSRKNDWNSIISKKRDFLIAKKIALTNDIFAFVGRILKDCPTRGGDIFTNLIGILGTGEVNGKPIPKLTQKIKTIMTGKIQFAEGGTSFSVMGGGESWIQCSDNTAGQLAATMTAEEWGDIESNMYGTWGWRYRESDIPNRHGHCNSNPNPSLTRFFNGFDLGTVKQVL